MSDQQTFEMKKLSPKQIRKIIKVGISLLLITVFIVLLFSSMFIVKEGEYKVVRQFGEVIRIEDQPGLTFRIPLLHSVTTLPNKKMVYDISEREINTLDKKRMIIDNYAVWEITAPEDMIANARTQIGAESRMGEFIFSVIRSELGSMEYEEIINDEGNTRGDLNQRVTERVNTLLERDQYGIQVDDVRIKRTDLPDENEQAVFNRMISERETKAQEYLSQGEAEKSRIVAQADREVQEMISKANAEAAEIRAEGEKEAATIYNESFQRDQEFYQLYRTLESYKKTIDDETTIVIPQGSPYADLLLGYTQ
ncbi:membrane protease subunit, stomatin/prohibitin [Gracilibacillus halophilus YIM-C55.5]|uniref:Protein HflC n=1 Tax=Gracilibacillus halophilus YIM-C55.5 TaxID=1308866 RepID=N4WLQ2_9BACI|nr:protease modulator HflC [Gracilibacillus halophilus]ENH97067.1 membrane protease subunit, stomatin/prohibitin [Gracilibacillus halophilus YIM-C55.5]